MQGGFSMKKTTKNEDLNFILSYRQAKEKSRELLEFERVFEKEINHASEFGFKNLKTGKYEISVEKQDDLFLNRVEEYLMRSERLDVARAYIRYRYKKEVARNY